MVATNTPYKVARRDHVLGELSKCLLIRNRDVNGMVEVSAFFLCLERLEGKFAHRDLFSAIDPRDAQGLSEDNINREDACVCDLDGNISM